MDEYQREKIREQAKDILSKFGKTLEKVKFKEDKEEKEVGGFREETDFVSAGDEFKTIMFNNAPNKEDEYLVMEIKKW